MANFRVCDMENNEETMKGKIMTFEEVKQVLRDLGLNVYEWESDPNFIELGGHLDGYDIQGSMETENINDVQQLDWSICWIEVPSGEEFCFGGILYDVDTQAIRELLDSDFTAEAVNPVSQS